MALAFNHAAWSERRGRRAIWADRNLTEFRQNDYSVRVFRIRANLMNDCFTLHAAKLQPDRLAERGRIYDASLTWKVGSSVALAARYDLDPNGPDTAFLSLRYWIGDQSHQQQIVLEREGGAWWFCCPLLKGSQACGRHVAKMYLPAKARHFGCRFCHGLVYGPTTDNDAEP